MKRRDFWQKRFVKHHSNLCRRIRWTMGHGTPTPRPKHRVHQWPTASALTPSRLTSSRSLLSTCSETGPLRRFSKLYRIGHISAPHMASTRTAAIFIHHPVMLLTRIRDPGPCPVEGQGQDTQPKWYFDQREWNATGNSSFLTINRVGRIIGAFWVGEGQL